MTVCRGNEVAPAPELIGRAEAGPQWVRNRGTEKRFRLVD
jgi:hypothetical protein